MSPCLPALPAIIDDADEFLPRELPAADLLISLGEHIGAAQMIPDMVKRSGARAVIAPADNRAWLPVGLARQIKQKLESVGVDMVYPVPFCTLTEDDSQNSYIREFAGVSARPDVDVEFYEDDRHRIGQRSPSTERPGLRGSTWFVADHLVGVWFRRGRGAGRASASPVPLSGNYGHRTGNFKTPSCTVPVTCSSRRSSSVSKMPGWIDIECGEGRRAVTASLAEQSPLPQPHLSLQTPPTCRGVGNPTAWVPNTSVVRSFKVVQSNPDTRQEPRTTLFLFVLAST